MELAQSNGNVTWETREKANMANNYNNANFSLEVCGKWKYMFAINELGLAELSPASYNFKSVFCRVRFVRKQRK